MMLQARWRQLVVSCDDPAADEQIAEAVARVVARYAIDLRSGLQVAIPQDGLKVTYVARPAINLASVVRAARRTSAARAVHPSTAGSQDQMGALKQLYAVASELHRAA